jgi:hypothetical protein
MANFAQIDENNIVTNVIVVSNDDCLDSDGSKSKLGIQFCKNLLGADTNWVLTSYGSTGMKYDSTNDVFYDPTPPYPSWVLNTSTWDWDAPVALPDDAGAGEGDIERVTYTWNEGFQEWTDRTVDTYDPDEDDYP